MIKIKLVMVLTLAVLSASVVQIHAMGGKVGQRCFIGGNLVGSAAAIKYMQQQIDNAPASQRAEVAQKLNHPLCYPIQSSSNTKWQRPMQPTNSAIKPALQSPFSQPTQQQPRYSTNPVPAPGSQFKKQNTVSEQPLSTTWSKKQHEFEL